MDAGVPISTLKASFKRSESTQEERASGPESGRRPAASFEDPAFDAAPRRAILASKQTSGVQRATVLRALAETNQVTPEDVLRTYVASGRGLLHAAGDAAARHAALEAARPLAAADKRVLLLTTDALRDGHADARLAAVAVVAAALRGNATAVGLVSRLPFGDDDGDVAAAAFRVAAEHAAALTAQQKRDVATAGAQAAIAAADPATRVAALALLEAAPDAPRADVLRNALAAAMADAVATVRLAALAAAAVAPRKAVDFELVAGLAASDARPDVRDAAEYLLLLLDVASDGANDGAEDAAPSEPVRHVAGEHAATGDDAYDSASSSDDEATAQAIGVHRPRGEGDRDASSGDEFLST